MDKLSDELTHTLRAKLAQEVEVRDVFKKDIADKVAECVMMARSVDDDGTGALPPELDVSSLRLSHGLMKLEEEQAKLDVVVSARTAEFAEARDAMRDASARLGEVLPAEFDDVGREDLTLGRLAAFREALERLKVVEAERAVEPARLRLLLERLGAAGGGPGSPISPRLSEALHAMGDVRPKRGGRGRGRGRGRPKPPFT